MTSNLRLESVEHLRYDHHGTVIARLDDAIEDFKWPFNQARLQELLNIFEPIKIHFLILSSDNVRLSKLIRDELQTVRDENFVLANDIIVIRQHQEGFKKSTIENRLIFKSLSI